MTYRCTICLEPINVEWFPEDEGRVFKGIVSHYQEENTLESGLEKLICPNFIYFFEDDLDFVVYKSNES